MGYFSRLSAYFDFHLILHNKMYTILESTSLCVGCIYSSKNPFKTQALQKNSNLFSGQHHLYVPLYIYVILGVHWFQLLNLSICFLAFQSWIPIPLRTSFKVSSKLINVNFEIGRPTLFWKLPKVIKYFKTPTYLIFDKKRH